ncbi:hypothetical protein M427DRAFT_40376 [Gonapodya prolifera JEL478]|uniref:Uncharacterized protein n=1 Tax=Gonapodya prolifera (strain JEL478) TaxID=1344416 RepID=A0A139B0N7_GONPJ|nr:hypothetical protein M427DRAFT_40376 [Gonapodya prolifera JEL478]|eukprot:KXS22539.1 hypothetical protein M427DRAFT_40376 [Gonapodya prolifera JEL478]
MSAASPKKATFTVSDLLPRVASLMQALDFPSAGLFVKKAVALAPNNPRLLDLAGRVALELGDLEEARTHFSLAETLDPTPDEPRDIEDAAAVASAVAEDPAWAEPILRPPSWARTMCLGQLTTGLEAAQAFEKGVKMMEKRIERLESERGLAPGQPVAQTNGSANGTKSANKALVNGHNEERQEDPLTVLREEVSSALCGLVELYMTDLCDDPSAEQLASTFAIRALHHSPSSPEALQTLASLRLSQQRPDDALEAALGATGGAGGWLESTLSALDGAETAPDGEPVDAAMPAYPARLSLAKLLIELGLLSRAFDVLRTCIAEDDEQMEPWYVWGWGYYLAGVEAGGGADGSGASGSTGVIGQVQLDGGKDARTPGEWFADSRDCFRMLEKLFTRYNALKQEELHSGREEEGDGMATDASEDEEDQELAAFSSMVQHATELLGEMEKMGGFEGGEEDDEGGDEGDDWEDVVVQGDGDGDEEMDDA